MTQKTPISDNIDHDTRRVNFSAELLEYRPLSVDRLVDYLTSGERFPNRGTAEHSFGKDN